MNKSRGWEIYPKGIYDFAMTMTRDYPDLDWFVSENGIGIEEDHAQRDEDGRIDDTSYRVPFVRDHLRWIARAIAEGARAAATTTGASSTAGAGTTRSRTATASSRWTCSATTRAFPKASAEWLRGGPPPT